MLDFEIRRRHMGDPINIVFPWNYVTDNTLALKYPRGIAVGAASPGYMKGGAPATGTSYMGFLTRDVTDQGGVTQGTTPVSTLVEIVLPTQPLALPFTAGLECSLEKAELYEAETAVYVVYSGTGAITAATPIGIGLSFDGQGRTYVAQSGDRVPFKLVDNSGLSGSALKPRTAGLIRIMCEMTSGA